MLQRYRLTLVDPRPVDIETTLTIRPRGGLPMHATRIDVPAQRRAV
jgi:hypothetical protein